MSSVEEPKIFMCGWAIGCHCAVLKRHKKGGKGRLILWTLLISFFITFFVLTHSLSYSFHIHTQTRFIHHLTQLIHLLNNMTTDQLPPRAEWYDNFMSGLTKKSKYMPYFISLGVVGKRKALLSTSLADLAALGNSAPSLISL